VGAETIRPCRAGEVDAVLALWGVSRSEHAVTPDTPERVAALLESESLLVAEADGELVGALIAAFDGWRGNMYRLAVVDAWRRRGIGRRLVEAGEARLRARGAPRITALVAFEDAEVRAFWESVGYAADPVMGRMVRTL
jgi:ribosomal protein S18 acetylase RimI-like enzyme